MDRSGRFIMIDGIAGSGKSTLLRAVQALLAERGLRAFNLAAWAKENPEPPRFEDVAKYDVLFTHEPTRQWIGAAIRYELSRADNPYGGTSLAHAFALDREIMYRRLILPALTAGKIVIQDRGVCSSIAYQPIMPDAISLDELVELPGNVLALEHAPHHLILTRLDPEIAAERIRARDEESKGVFADIAFLRRVHERFHSDWYAELFRAHGTHVHALPTDKTVEQTAAQTRELFSSLLELVS